MSTTDDRTDNVESFEEYKIESVEEDYKHGNLDAIVVTCTFVRGSRVGSSGPSGEHVDEEVTIQAEYTLSDEVLALTGFYPTGNVTGRALFRNTLQCLQALEGVHDALVDRHGDTYAIEPYDVTMMDLL